ncbi:MAG: D-alanyl-D-alanine carboxypeptidase [Alphaproteobacteria bacterium]|nr:D-alanyl-D-alanine carboxypeptidase [Alphaproteobacteria bacterium]
MKVFAFHIFAFIFLLGTLSTPLYAVSKAKAIIPQYGSIVIDAHTGAVLHQAHADTKTYPASLTKMMTLYMLFEVLEKRKIHSLQKFKVSQHASRQAPSKLHLKPGDSITAKDAIFALMTHSANDVAVVVAEALGGTESNFARLMTKKAHQLGMHNTTFYNASGLPHKHQKTTARDMATLSRALYYHFPLYYRYFNTKLFSFRGRQYKNHNHLLGKVPGVDGIKTGFTCAAGFNLAASAARGGRRLIGVVLGGKTRQWRDKHMTDLLNGTFQIIFKNKKMGLLPLQKPTMQLAAATSTYEPSDLQDLADPLPEPILKTAKPIFKEKQNWAVQVGAFSQAHLAHKAATNTQSQMRLLKNTRVSISSSKTRRKQLYRAKLLGLSKNQAHQVCQALNQIGRDCIALQP